MPMSGECAFPHVEQRPQDGSVRGIGRLLQVQPHDAQADGSHTRAQVALAWLLSLRPNVLLIPGTSSVRHLEENLAVSGIELDEQARDELAAAA